ncbi:hypothetical protein WHR41_03418 [Cladosporium halotolerans]|uniref:Rhodopsin domain-containing protein n=1 Tax=Cladosporium halotolerans TaxID=1052096 RepID=A0AB34KX22_9PEZI
MSARDPNDVGSRISTDNRGSVVNVAAIFGICCSLLFLAARLWMRRPLRSLFGRDDTLVVVTTALSILQSALAMSSVTFGLGKRRGGFHTPHVDAMEKLLYASDIVYVGSLCAGKMAVIFLFLRIASAPTLIKSSKFMASMIGIWGMISFFVVSFVKDMDHPWQISAGRYEDALPKWIALEAIGGFYEICMAAFALLLMWELQMPTSSKVSVVAGFAMRLPLLAIAAARLLSLSKAFSSDDLTFSLATPAAWAQVEMHYNIIAATIPCLRIFLKDFTTGWLGTRSNRMEECTRSTKSNTYGSRHSAVRKAGDVLQIELQPRGRGQVESKIEHDAMNDAASDDSQQRIFVNRRIDIMYEER